MRAQVRPLSTVRQIPPVVSSHPCDASSMATVTGDPVGLAPDRSCAIGTIAQPARPAALITTASIRRHPPKERSMEVETTPNPTLWATNILQPLAGRAQSVPVATCKPVIQVRRAITIGTVARQPAWD